MPRAEADRLLAGWRDAVRRVELDPLPLKPDHTQEHAS
jgi:hypothetical protein